MKTTLFTGHSLGGGLACTASLVDKRRKAIVFNSSGVPYVLKPWFASLQSYDINRYHNKYDMLSNILNNPSLILNNPFLSNNERILGLYLPWDSSTVIDEENPIGKGRFSAEAHSIDSVIQALGRRPQQTDQDRK